jgi:type VI secretion system protein ImpA
MPTPDSLDFTKLLAPIPGEKPVGADLRINAGPTSLYYQIKDGRTNARAAERRMEGGIEDAVPPDWKAVSTAAIKALAESSKDLELAAYLIEALCRTNGFAGLRDGFKLTRGLVEQYWDSLYPTPDEEGIATRLAPLTGLNGDDAEGTLIAPINRIPITDSANLGRLTYSNYLQAVATGKLLDPKVKDKRIASGAMHMELIQKAVDETDPKYYRAIFDDLNGALEELNKLGQVLDAKAGNFSPPTKAIRTALENVLASINDVAKAKIAVTATTKKTEDKKGNDAEGKAGPLTNGKAVAEEDKGEKLPTIRNREDALNAILQLGDYFRRTEPHSLVPFALEQAVRWARMGLPELMMELIPEENPRKALFKQVGIRLPDAPAKEEKKK